MKKASCPNHDGINRRRFLAASGASSALASLTIADAEQTAAARITSGLADCQSHLFFPAVLDVMRKRKTDPLVYDKDGTTFLKMGDWLRKVPPPYLSVETKLAAMDASGIAITLLSNNDPGPEWFGDGGAGSRDDYSRFAGRRHRQTSHPVPRTVLAAIAKRGRRRGGTRPLRGQASVLRLTDFTL